MGKDFLDELFGEMDPLGLYDTDKDGHYDDEEIALLTEDEDDLAESLRDGYDDYDDFDDLDEDEGDFDEDSDEDDDDDF